MWSVGERAWRLTAAPLGAGDPGVVGQLGLGRGHLGDGVIVLNKSLSSVLLWAAKSTSSGVRRLLPLFWASWRTSSRTLAARYWMMATR